MLKKRVLISGGAGFIASHLLEELIKNKNYDITVIDDFSTGKVENLKPFQSVNILKGRIQDSWFNKKFDIIYHLASKANTREKGLKDFEDNIMATEAIVKFLKPNGHIYFSSSSAVYGNQPVATEESPFRPISPYGYSKWMNELTIKDNCRNYTIFRFSNVFGERQDGSNEMGLIGVIDYHLKNKSIMEVFNEGNNERDWIYVKDVVKALTTVSKVGIFNVGRFETYKTIDLVKLSKVWWQEGKNNNEVETIRLNNTKLKNTGWTPTLEVTEFLEGLEE